MISRKSFFLGYVPWLALFTHTAQAALTHDLLHPLSGRLAITKQQFENLLSDFEALQLQELSKQDLWLDPVSAAAWASGDWAMHFNPYVQRLTIAPGSTVALWGDLHGSWQSLIKSLTTLRERGFIDDNLHITSPNTYCVFLGDMVDRGPDGVEVLSLVILLKLKNPRNVIVVRGNHEDGTINEHFGFGHELRAKYRLSAQEILRVYRMYETLPVALYLSSGTPQELCSVLCCHGAFEVGFNAQPLLATSKPLCFQDIGILHRAERVDAMPASLKTPIISCFGHPRHLRLFGDFDEHQLTSCRPQSLTVPYTLGFAWHDFIDDGSHAAIAHRKGRGWVYGRTLTDYLLDLDSTAHNRLIGVFRGHQHNGPMLGMLQKSKGITQLWNRMIYTIVSGASAGGQNVDGTFALLIPGATQQEWRVYHGGDNFSQI